MRWQYHSPVHHSLIGKLSSPPRGWSESFWALPSRTPQLLKSSSITSRPFSPVGVFRIYSSRPQSSYVQFHSVNSRPRSIAGSFHLITSRCRIVVIHFNLSTSQRRSPPDHSIFFLTTSELCSPVWRRRFYLSYLWTPLPHSQSRLFKKVVSTKFFSWPQITK